MAYVSHKLKNPVEGALAGGGETASTPLYVFGPVLKVLIIAGIARVSFGASIWIAIVTIAFVTLLYRSVMLWITDGSGGSGLAEEEFGGWAVKITAAVTFIEFTLTYIVSIAALATFASDRMPFLNETYLLLQNRTYLAIFVGAAIAWVVNHGPRIASKVFGPATGAIIVLLWVLIISSIYRYGFSLPSFNLEAFSKGNISTTLGAYARLLVVITGVEIFANMVASFSGKPKERSKKAFRSMTIVILTVCATLLIVGPAVFKIADINNKEVSVFTQTMDVLLPNWLSILATVASIAVLLSAAAASALGLQNLAVGLKLRHYIPSFLGKLNRHGVASRPVILEASISCIAFLIFGTHEETYLALYAAGVFVLFTLAGLAASKRLIRFQKQQKTAKNLLMLSTTSIASVFTITATFIAIYRRFDDGVWIYFILVPAIFLIFTLFRRVLGEPTPIEERTATNLEQNILTDADSSLWELESHHLINNVVVPIDSSHNAIRAAFAAKTLADRFDSELHLVSAVNMVKPAFNLEELPGGDGTDITILPLDKNLPLAISKFANQKQADLIVIGTKGNRKKSRLTSRSITAGILKNTDCPVLVLPPKYIRDHGISVPKKIMITLDGSRQSERALSFAINAVKTFKSEITLLSVPTSHGEVKGLEKYLETVKSFLRAKEIAAETVVEGTDPITTIPQVAEDRNIDLIFMTTRGRSGIANVIVGSITAQIVRTSEIPVVVVPMVED